MKEETFIFKVFKEFLEAGFSLKILQKEGLGKGGQHGGYFDSSLMEISIAYKSEDRLCTIIHEYNHFLQWKNRRIFWLKYGGESSVLSEWLNGTDFSKHRITKEIKNLIRIERDCEIRTVKTFDKYKFKYPDGRENYIRGCNAYIFCHLYVKKYRKYPSSKYMNNSFFQNFPNEFLPISCYFKGVDKKGNDMTHFFESI